MCASTSSSIIGIVAANAMASHTSSTDIHLRYGAEDGPILEPTNSFEINFRIEAVLPMQINIVRVPFRARAQRTTGHRVSAAYSAVFGCASRPATFAHQSAHQSAHSQPRFMRLTASVFSFGQSENFPSFSSELNMSAPPAPTPAPPPPQASPPPPPLLRRQIRFDASQLSGRSVSAVARCTRVRNGWSGRLRPAGLLLPTIARCCRRHATTRARRFAQPRARQRTNAH